ncbi:hypothetical protein H0I76_01385 [Limibaculum sp. M0105]|uniref:Uncharacterized protein n=1 Tax=Thermohalobaculum xanthum TaxID=2753746 RepID=A0A8J7M436_9RHOB|nr:DUF6732 family protein [Thermohalobaculum xanthum]MBK0397829.1 hypothetical protein [Thermohalobaculum xanthum]
MKKLAALLAAVPATALAHPGHYAETAGHTHWLALGAMGLAGLVTAVAVVRRARSIRRARKDVRAETR